MFRVKIEPEKRKYAKGKDEFWVSSSHGGMQWNSFKIDPNKARIMIKAIRKHLCEISKHEQV